MAAADAAELLLLLLSLTATATATVAVADAPVAGNCSGAMEVVGRSSELPELPTALAFALATVLTTLLVDLQIKSTAKAAYE